MAALGPFVYRENRDKTVDAICTRCYRTIAKGASVMELQAAEMNHVCEKEFELYQFRQGLKQERN
jgi:hypothetical protein